MIKAIAEAAAFHDGVVIVQADEIVDDSGDLPRVDIPGSWVDYSLQDIGIAAVARRAIRLLDA
jgi:acyl CoA:acetate/3-ketoacid CoA transferase